MSIKVSVIVPIYNVENYLSQCLESIINQTLTDIEIICVNDGSTDSSKQIIENFLKNDKRIISVNKHNEGYGAACNTGLRLARGEYISIIEADDFIDQNMLKDLYKLATENKSDIVKASYYEYKNFNINEESIEKINWSKQYSMPDKTFTIKDCPQLLYFHPSIWSCIYKREFLNKNNISFVETKGAGWVDNPFQIQTLCLAKRIFYSDNPYYYYRLDNPNSSSNIVNISNPFDRSDEVHSLITSYNINDNNILAHLYKREFSYIHIVLNGIQENMFETAYKKINDMIKRMDKDIIKNNQYINEYEKSFYEKCQTKDGIKEMMYKIKENNTKVKVTCND